MASTTVRSKAVGSVVVVSLFVFALIDCAFFLFSLCFVMQYLVSFLVCNHLASILVFLLSCGCKCSVFLPCGTVGWSIIIAFPPVHTHFLRLLNRCYTSPNEKLGIFVCLILYVPVNNLSVMYGRAFLG